MRVTPNIDALIDSYDVETDPVLTQEFTPIMTGLLDRIRTYGAGVNDYGDIVARHLTRTSMIGREFLVAGLGLSDKIGRNFYDANLLQDLGKTHKVYGDGSIWSLPHRPSDIERSLKREHIIHGPTLLDEALADASGALKNHPHMQVIKAIQLYHHEKVDGTGHFKIHGDDLGTILKAICIVDTYDGDMIPRPHQLAMRTPEQALKRMHTSHKYQGTFDPELLQRFVDFTLNPR